MTRTLAGQLVTPDGVRAGRVVFGTHLQGVESQDDAPGGVFILPGFIDAHVHGGGGGDTMDGEAGIRTLARAHAARGTTTLLPTTITRPWADVLGALHAVRQVMTTGVPGGADVPGAHLEGPFISPHRLGAQPNHTLAPTAERVEALLTLGVLRAVTLAPEVDGAVTAAAQFARAGVRVGVGHTVATYAQTRAVLDAVHANGGQAASTHLYNAMGGLTGREPGPLGALLTDAHAYHELILDGHHLHPASFQLALACAPDRATLITDAMRAAGLGDGPSELGGQAVQVEGGAARLADGTLAGSVLTLDVALRHAVYAGVPLAHASALLSAHPARSLKLTDRGELRAGLRADLVVLNADLHVQQVYVAGTPILEENP
ncbi:N-acetylglucosamine-6-phosphate deacetylase [Deinococcus maricopensis]|uniref:N-acetylglucosamine-6-phosphate deacetylase n=1 Tax=Deinococcus maricopensis (strain DSM 21211 / LMG 22137 / NRRL B-23946 / LB-34) TaxID=709986 RepID=E8U560_DEIML|nr:N-acetylglucosamine-6-phosphate deacetylase [Deinococcus maricopensis]ADV66199.1 N-acetylglucosamine-6-phosphate deacetylase [Deinococcus maricopensis DSM 21211]